MSGPHEALHKLFELEAKEQQTRSILWTSEAKELERIMEHVQIIKCVFSKKKKTPWFPGHIFPSFFFSNLNNYGFARRSPLWTPKAKEQFFFKWAYPNHKMLEHFHHQTSTPFIFATHIFLISCPFWAI
jgi:peptide subunit release factor RF-3